MSDEKKDPKPGYKTTEFYLSTAAMIVGVILASGAFGEDSAVMKIAGIAATVLGALGYTVSRGMAKKAAKVVAFFLLPLLIVGCCKGHVRADGINDLVVKITERHDKLLELVDPLPDLDGDGKVDEPNRETYLRSTEILRRTVAKAADSD